VVEQQETEPTEENKEAAERRAAAQREAVRRIVTRRERAPRSPRMERALKRLIWRYTGVEQKNGKSK
jgi:hypothetical protein